MEIIIIILRAIEIYSSGWIEQFLIAHTSLTMKIKLKFLKLAFALQLRRKHHYATLDAKKLVRIISHITYLLTRECKSITVNSIK